jgi:hypothetical protein
MESNLNPLPWHIVEQQISNEIQWLKSSIPIFTTSCNNVKDCECDYRRIATAIVSGLIHAKEIKTNKPNTLWNNIKSESIKHKHGKGWHRDMMNLVDSYFSKDGFNIVTEPPLNFGRADLGVYKNGFRDLFVEIGTTSIHKLSLNLLSMPDVIFLLVPEENRIIEFVTLSI